MTNADLKKRYNSVFEYHILFTHEGRTLLAGTYKKPGSVTEAFCYVPELDDFEKVNEKNILCFIRITKQKSAL